MIIDDLKLRVIITIDNYNPQLSTDYFLTIRMFPIQKSAL